MLTRLESAHAILMEDLVVHRVVTKFLPRSSIRHAGVFQQVSYFPDLALCDFWLFPKMKMLLNHSPLTAARTSYGM